MTILVCGGGTGGHITPTLAIAHELKLLDKNCKTVYVIEKNSRFLHLVKDYPDIDDIRDIRTGKWRRYHGESFIRQVFDFKTLLLNIRDFFITIGGFWQSYRLISVVKPQVVFIKGGFVGLPLGLVAALKKIPIITHDSDSLSGLTNRVVGRWAAYQATGLPAELYHYPPSKAVFTGIPVSKEFAALSHVPRNEILKKVGLPNTAQVLLITGGSQGAKRLNVAIAPVVTELIQKYPNLHVFHQVGSGNISVYSMGHERLVVKEFITDMSLYMAAADIVIARSSATTIAEAGILAKAMILVPSPVLAGGHQVVNAEYLESQGAALNFSESSLQNSTVALMQSLEELLASPEKRRVLGVKLNSVSKPDAAKVLAQLILRTADKV